jgi:hypothetical protein
MAMPGDELRVEIEPFGPDRSQVRAFSARVLEHAALRELLGRSEHRMIGIAPVDEPGRKTRGPGREDLFRATVYDYTNDRTLEAVGRVGDPRTLRIEESARQPLPSSEELDLAVRVLSQDEHWGHLLSAEGVRTMSYLPPLLNVELPDGRWQRRIGVVVIPRSPRERFRVAAVDIVRGVIEEFEPIGGDNAECGPPDAGQAPTRYTPGQAWVTVWQGGTRLWRFLARRPAGSSGTNGSGIELKYVDYHDKRVLYQAHVPILNVKYDDGCGAFLDWQSSESPFQANGSDPVPGFRLCSSPPTTILDTEDDNGNFSGVAVYVDGQEVVLVSEMEAGWYRYISSWRFHVDGTIRPRFGFDAIQYYCVCNVHHHHPYWRLDFDIQTPANNVVSEFNDPPLVAIGGNWHDKTFEIQRARDPARKRKWRVTNSKTGAAYEIVPGASDGVATASPDWPFPQGDLWVVRWKSGAEIDNGVLAIGPPYEANIANFMNGEPIKDQDVVVWYGAHFTHDVSGPHVPHIVGPDLVPVKW